MGPDLNWFKSYDTKRKTFDFLFLQQQRYARAGNDIPYIKMKHFYVQK